MFTRYPYSVMPPFPADPDVIRSQYQLLIRTLASRLMDDDLVHARAAAAAAMRCREEWSNVNDPPCHPSDAGWTPCPLCQDQPKDLA